MFHTNERIIKHKVGLRKLAEESGNASRACQIMGLSRDIFYRYKQAVVQGAGPLMTCCTMSKARINVRCAVAARP